MNSKVNALRAIIREEVQDAIREELGAIFENLTLAPQQQAIEEVRRIDPAEAEAARRRLKEKMSNAFGVPQPVGVNPLNEASKPNSYLNGLPKPASDPLADLLAQTANEMTPHDRQNHTRLD